MGAIGGNKPGGRTPAGTPTEPATDTSGAQVVLIDFDQLQRIETLLLAINKQLALITGVEIDTVEGQE